VIEQHLVESSRGSQSRGFLRKGKVRESDVSVVGRAGPLHATHVEEFPAGECNWVRAVARRVSEDQRCVAKMIAAHSGLAVFELISSMRA